IVTIDDYAHHPTEVKVTIKGARQKYPNKEIVAILLIHTWSRAAKFKQEFVDALNLADKAYVMDVYVDRKEDIEPFDCHEIIKLLDNGEYIDNTMADKLLVHENAVIIFMSSKEIYVLQNDYEEKLKIKQSN
ncbi:MAG: cyanophycin synthetase, partial [Bacilli bacterium]|nr:cyanophycin synthetase [Bacilli bacterium]